MTVVAAANFSRATFGMLELWTCPDLSPASASGPSGLLHKLRRREWRDYDGTVLASGLHLRPFCSPTFAPGVTPPVYDDEHLAYVVRYLNGSLAGDNYW